MIRMLTLVCLFVLPDLAAAGQGAPQILSRDGRYLGTLSSNPYDPDSVSNPYGRYGSPFSPDSINNPYGLYGSRYSSESVHNPYATRAPIIVAPCVGYCPN